LVSQKRQSKTRRRSSEHALTNTEPHNQVLIMQKLLVISSHSADWTVEELGRLWFTLESGVDDMEAIAGFVKTKTARECSEKLKKFLFRQMSHLLDNSSKLNVK
jgi:hypothetical protein